MVRLALFRPWNRSQVPAGRLFFSELYGFSRDGSEPRPEQAAASFFPPERSRRSLASSLWTVEERPERRSSIVLFRPREAGLGKRGSQAVAQG